MNVTDQDPAADRLHPIEVEFRPLHDNILVFRLPDGAPKSLIIEPETARKPSRYGTVMAVGPGKRDAQGYRRPLDVKPGDVIRFGRFTDFDDGYLLIIREPDVEGIVG